MLAKQLQKRSCKPEVNKRWPWLRLDKAGGRVSLLPLAVRVVMVHHRAWPGTGMWVKLIMAVMKSQPPPLVKSKSLKNRCRSRHPGSRPSFGPEGRVPPRAVLKPPQTQGRRWLHAGYPKGWVPGLVSRLGSRRDLLAGSRPGRPSPPRKACWEL